MPRRRTGVLATHEREVAYLEENAEHLLTAIERSRAASTRAWEDVESGSASRAFKGKQKLQDALASLTDAIKSARLARSVSGGVIERRPKHAPFDKDHAFLRQYDALLERAEATRRRLVKSSFGTRESVRAGLASERDRGRTMLRAGRTIWSRFPTRTPSYAFVGRGTRGEIIEVRGTGKSRRYLVRWETHPSEVGGYDADLLLTEDPSRDPRGRLRLKRFVTICTPCGPKRVPTSGRSISISGRRSRRS